MKSPNLSQILSFSFLSSTPCTAAPCAGGKSAVHGRSPAPHLPSRPPLQPRGLLEPCHLLPSLPGRHSLFSPARSSPPSGFPCRHLSSDVFLEHLVQRVPLQHVPSPSLLRFPRGLFRISPVTPVLAYLSWVWSGSPLGDGRDFCRLDSQCLQRCLAHGSK